MNDDDVVQLQMPVPLAERMMQALWRAALVPERLDPDAPDLAAQVWNHYCRAFGAAPQSVASMIPYLVRYTTPSTDLDAALRAPTTSDLDG
jgi:hypothetical protein